MPKLGRRRLAREVVQLLNNRPNRQHDIIQQLAGYLVDTKQTKQLDLLVQDIADELFVQNGHLSADVTTAQPMADADIRTALTTMLTQNTGAKTVELHNKTDKTIVGGVLVRTSRHELDATVRSQLKQIAGGIK